MVLRALHDRTAVAGKLGDDITGIQLTAYQSQMGRICFSACLLPCVMYDSDTKGIKCVIGGPLYLTPVYW